MRTFSKLLVCVGLATFLAACGGGVLPESAVSGRSTVQNCPPDLENPCGGGGGGGGGSGGGSGAVTISTLYDWDNTGNTAAGPALGAPFNALVPRPYFNSSKANSTCRQQSHAFIALPSDTMPRGTVLRPAGVVMPDSVVNFSFFDQQGNYLTSYSTRWARNNCVINETDEPGFNTGNLPTGRVYVFASFHFIGVYYNPPIYATHLPFDNMYVGSFALQ